MLFVIDIIDIIWLIYQPSNQSLFILHRLRATAFKEPGRPMTLKKKCSSKVRLKKNWKGLHFPERDWVDLIFYNTVFKNWRFAPHFTVNILYIYEVTAQDDNCIAIYFNALQESTLQFCFVFFLIQLWNPCARIRSSCA